jgi:hypothetical protein
LTTAPARGLTEQGVERNGAETELPRATEKMAAVLRLEKIKSEESCERVIMHNPKTPSITVAKVSAPKMSRCQAHSLALRKNRGALTCAPFAL